MISIYGGYVDNRDIRIPGTDPGSDASSVTCDHGYQNISKMYQLLSRSKF